MKTHLDTINKLVNHSPRHPRRLLRRKTQDKRHLQEQHEGAFAVGGPVAVGEVEFSGGGSGAVGVGYVVCQGTRV
jgi:hypothetical protein